MQRLLLTKMLKPGEELDLFVQDLGLFLQVLVFPGEVGVEVHGWGDGVHVGVDDHGDTGGG